MMNNKKLAHIIKTGNPEAKSLAIETMIKNNIPLVNKIALSYNSNPQVLKEMIIDGTYGLYKAILRYDPNKKDINPLCTFANYASHWIRKYIIEGIKNRCGLIVKIPTSKLNNALKLKTNKKLNDNYKLDNIEDNEAAEYINNISVYSFDQIDYHYIHDSNKQYLNPKRCEVIEQLLHAMDELKFSKIERQILMGIKMNSNLKYLIKQNGLDMSDVLAIRKLCLNQLKTYLNNKYGKEYGMESIEVFNG